MWLAGIAFLILAARVIYLEFWLTQSHTVSIRRKGWMTCELRRRVSMERLPGHVGEYPVPREERILVDRLLGLAIWHREISIALPHSVSESLTSVAPHDFDSQFPAWLRIAAFAKSGLLSKPAI